MFPEGGLHLPGGAKPVTSSEGELNVKIGSGEALKAYSFDDAFELVPGTWTLQLWHAGRKLAEQKFTVTK